MAMNWQKRWREMILAGGAATVVACGSSRHPDPCGNAGPDPCCEYKYNGGPLTPECTSEMACEAEGGTWNDGVQACGVPTEAGPDAPFDSAAPDADDAGGGG
jgi:hypothetical protein